MHRILTPDSYSYSCVGSKSTGSSTWSRHVNDDTVSHRLPGFIFRRNVSVETIRRNISREEEISSGTFKPLNFRLRRSTLIHPLNTLDRRRLAGKLPAKTVHAENSIGEIVYLYPGELSKRRITVDNFVWLIILGRRCSCLDNVHWWIALRGRCCFGRVSPERTNERG